MNTITLTREALAELLTAAAVVGMSLSPEMNTTRGDVAHSLDVYGFAGTRLDQRVARAEATVHLITKAGA